MESTYGHSRAAFALSADAIAASSVLGCLRHCTTKVAFIAHNNSLGELNEVMSENPSCWNDTVSASR